MFKIINSDCFKIINKIDLSLLKEKTVLITGASGIVGTYLVECLKQVQKKHNIKIYCWINNDVEPTYKNFYKGCKIIKGDITDSNVFKKIKVKFDVIFHAAGYGQPNKFLQNKIKTIQLNTDSTIKLFNTLNFGGTFIFMSTSEIYSGIDADGIDENFIGISNTDHPRSCYIEGKRCGEAICHAYSNDYVVKIIRLSLAYGPGTKKNDQRVLNSIFQKALEHGKIKLLDSGSSMRTYGYISDIIEMILNIAINGKQIVYNVSGESKTSILNLAKEISNLTNVELSVPIDDREKLLGTPNNVNLNLQRYFSEFPKIEFIPLSEGLKRTLQWQKGLYEK